MEQDSVYVIREILGRSLALDESAVRFYSKLSESTANPPLRDFWRAIAEEEANHVIKWKDLIESQDQIPPGTIENPGSTLERLVYVDDRFVKLLGMTDPRPDRNHHFVLSYWLESFLLDPGIIPLISFGLQSQDRALSVVTDHIDFLIKAYRQFGEPSSEGEALMDALTIPRALSGLIRQGETDSLTGLYNRRGFYRSVVPLIQHARRYGYPVGVMLLDIDNFKYVNDTFGHLSGDSVIQQTAKIIKDEVRDSDVVARFGGDEFVVYFSGIAPGANREVADKIRTEVLRKIDYPISLSMGIVESNGFYDIDKLIQSADSFMYQAKALGKNRIVVGNYEPK